MSFYIDNVTSFTHNDNLINNLTEWLTDYGNGDDDNTYCCYHHNHLSLCVKSHFIIFLLWSLLWQEITVGVLQ